MFPPCCLWGCELVFFSCVRAGLNIEINVTSSSIRFDGKMIPVVPHNFGSGAVVWVAWGQGVCMGRRRWGWWGSDVVSMCTLQPAKI